MKDLKIGKEFLSEVLKEEIVEILGIDKKNDLVYKIMTDVKCDNGYDSKAVGTHINIYEFAFKCKEWAKNKEYIVHSSPTQKIEHTAIVQSFDINKFYYGENQFYALTEVEAIIKACEWIIYKENK